ncbi:MAG: hypothetical protein GX956_03200, partial [Firmicutes bacterium]|nr:hypothetical protein [Bacillota bacterium]
MYKKSRVLTVLALVITFSLAWIGGVLAATATVQQVDKYGNITLNILTE